MQQRATGTGRKHSVAEACSQPRVAAPTPGRWWFMGLQLRPLVFPQPGGQRTRAPRTGRTVTPREGVSQQQPQRNPHQHEWHSLSQQQQRLGCGPPTGSAGLVPATAAVHASAAMSCSCSCSRGPASQVSLRMLPLGHCRARTFVPGLSECEWARTAGRHTDPALCWFCIMAGGPLLLQVLARALCALAATYCKKPGAGLR